MTDYKGIMAVIVDAAEKEGVRFNISDFPDGEIECRNEHVMIFRGSAGEFIDRLFKSDKGSLST